jgi:phospholipase C
VPSPHMPEHVIVLMLENRSFDHMLGFLRQEMPELDGLTGRESNPLEVARPGADLTQVTDNAAYTGDFARHGSGKPVDVDPGHEHVDVDAQLYVPIDGQRPASPNNLGFVNAYRLRKHSSRQLGPNVMRCFAPDRVPALATLAREFVVCDGWFSSVPGPTWPNRLFVHTGTSDGHVVHTKKLYGMRTIYDLFRAKGLAHRNYAGDIPQALLLKRLLFSGIFFQMDAFFAHIRKGKLGSYSFIEPDYFGGNANDQHPPHDVAAGERLIADVYDALRNSPYWDRSVLIVLYDEHGGLYDHVPPPQARSPDGKVSTSPPFEFDRLGVRVPAVIVSPWVERGKPDHRHYDHTSIIATCREWFGLGDPLTRRDATAALFSHLLSLTAPRTDAPVRLPRPQLTRARARRLAPPPGAPLSDLQRQLLELAKTVDATQKRAGVVAPRARVLPRAARSGEDFAREYVREVYARQTAVSHALEEESTNPARSRRAAPVKKPTKRTKSPANKRSKTARKRPKGRKKG